MPSKLLCIDMDDVIFVKGFERLISLYLGKEFISDSKTFYLQDYLEDKDEFFKFFFKHNMYDYSDIPSNCQEIMEQLNNQYKLIVLTSYMFRGYEKESARVASDKHLVLLEKFPFLKSEQIALVNDKSIVSPDIMIDDKVGNLAYAKRKLLYTAYHNQNISNEELEKERIERVDSWSDVGKKLILK